MKAQVTSVKPEKKFEPVTLEIVFESLNELEFFWSLLNVCGNDLKAFASEHKKKGMGDFGEVSTYQLWNEIDEAIKCKNR